MKKTILLISAFILLAGLGYKVHSAHAQFTFTPSGAGTTVSNCPAVATSVTVYCFVSAGAYQSINGAAWAPMVTAAPTASVSVTINGVTKPCPSAAPCSFTISSGVSVQ